ncbi:hypothetical protein L7F22_011542 [Adiantum nelumboides]|nr:hypothetical protein [Adiantum nelumboides]
MADIPLIPGPLDPEKEAEVTSGAQPNQQNWASAHGMLGLISHTVVTMPSSLPLSPASRVLFRPPVGQVVPSNPLLVQSTPAQQEEHPARKPVRQLDFTTMYDGTHSSIAETSVQPTTVKSSSPPRAPRMRSTFESKEGTPKKSKQCNCKNSRCLKLYCECFASGTYCDGCNCLNCCNNVENESFRKEAVEATLERNPNAFRPKIASSPGSQRENRLVHVADKKNVVADALSRRPHVAAVWIAYQHELDEMRDHYSTDEDFVEPYTALVRGKHPNLYSLKDGFLMFCGKLCVSQLLRQKVMTESHSPHYASHRGIDSMIKALEMYFFWPSLRKDTESFVRSCLICQRVKYDRGKAYGLLQPLSIPTAPWERIAMDFIFGLPKTSSGYEGIWTIVDRFSKHAHLVPVKRKLRWSRWLGISWSLCSSIMECPD